MDSTNPWITLAFNRSGLQALGVPEDSLASFPDEFREGMVARVGILDDTGANHPGNWVGGLASDELHAIAILFARNGGGHGGNTPPPNAPGTQPTSASPTPPNALPAAGE